MTPRLPLFADAADAATFVRGRRHPSARLRANHLCASSPLALRLRRQVDGDSEFAGFNHLIARDAAPFGSDASPFAHALSLDTRLVGLLEDGT